MERHWSLEKSLKQTRRGRLRFPPSCLSDPSHVIGLYPNLLPQDFRNQLEYPDKLPELEGVELEKGLLALINYLTQVS